MDQVGGVPFDTGHRVSMADIFCLNRHVLVKITCLIPTRKLHLMMENFINKKIEVSFGLL